MRDVIIIGAGAAGIGAGLALLRQTADFVILEAKDRVGGRAYAESHSLGLLWDHGCHWFHSASLNPLRQIALKLGHPFDDQPKDYTDLLLRDGVALASDMYESSHAALMSRVGGHRGDDVSLRTLMDPSSPWDSLLRHGMALSYSQEPEQVSVRDAQAFRDTGENVPVGGSYGALIERLAAFLPIQLSCPVVHVEVTPHGVAVMTQDKRFEARRVIVAVPQRVLERGLICFEPALPPEVTDAIASLPMGWFEKVGFAFDAPVVPASMGEGIEAVVGMDGADWPVYFKLIHGRQPAIIAHVAGHRAKDLPEAALIAQCEEAMVRTFGDGVRRHITRRAASRWGSDPHIGGAYSCALPGKAHMRQRLHAPVHGCIHFAGEHTSLDAMATAHGAYLSGQRAALAALGKGAADGDPLWLPGYSGK